MGNRPDRARTKAPRRARKHKDLLAIWLDLFKQVDNPPRRRAAKLRRTQRPRRPIPLQRLRLQVYGSRLQAMATPASRRTLIPDIERYRAILTHRLLRA